MDEFKQNIKKLYHSKFEFELPPNSIFDNILDLYNKSGIKYQYKDEKNGIQFSLNDDKIIVNYKNIDYEIEKEPFEFYDEENKLLGKAYDTRAFELILDMISDNLEIYNENNIELKTNDDILNNKSHKFILKGKIKFSEDIFKLLNLKRVFDPEQITPITIPKYELSPIPLKEFHSKENDIK